jgi:hypothetical protein
LSSVGSEDAKKALRRRMRYRTFGRTGWQVSEIGYGMWGMGGWTGSDDAQSLESLQRAVDLGCNFFDTAFVYGNGRSENLLGELVRNNPEKRIYTATKVPPKNMQYPTLPNTHSRNVIRRNTSKSFFTRVSLMPVSKVSTFFKFTLGTTTGPMMIVGRTCSIL